MHDFITALEFLTRIRFSHSDDWSPQDFSRSVPYFPLVGLIIGSILAVVNYGLLFLYIPDFLRGTLLIFAEIIITGGLMYDGYMDTADGVFSARKRERMLEIMKDSHVGSNAVLAVIVLIMLKMGVYLAISGVVLTKVIIAMSVATRTFMVLYIVNFPYARKEGIGKLFKQYAKQHYSYIAIVLGLIFVVICGINFLVIALFCLLMVLLIARYISKMLGGLTGDTYGALTEVGNVLYLLIAYFILR